MFKVISDKLENCYDVRTTLTYYGRKCLSYFVTVRTM